MRNDLPSRRRALRACLLLGVGVLPHLAAQADTGPAGLPLREAGTLRVAVYNGLAPFSDKAWRCARTRSNWRAACRLR